MFGNVYAGCLILKRVPWKLAFTALHISIYTCFLFYNKRVESWFDHLKWIDYHWFVACWKFPIYGCQI